MVTRGLSPLKALIPAAAAIALALVGVSGCSSSGGTELIVSGEMPEAEQGPTPAAASTPHEAAPLSSPGQPEAQVERGPEGQGLVWTEVDLRHVFSDESRTIWQLESVGDGKVLASSLGYDGPSRVLVTENGMDWAEIRLPSNLELRNADMAGDRWVIQGWDNSSDDPAALVFISDDEGSTWTEAEIDTAAIDGLVVMADAMASGEQVLVVASSFPAPPDYQRTSDAAAEPELGEGSVHVLLSDGGPARWVAELPGWYNGGFGASDGFYLLSSGTSEEYAMYSPDGRQWTTSIIDRDRSEANGEVIWVGGLDGGLLKAERFEGLYGPEQVLARPEAVGGIADLAVGPPGVAVVGWPSSPYADPDGGFALPEFSIEKDGFELRYNQPPGSITLWDAAEGAAVYVLDFESLEGEELPQGVREVETGDGLPLVVFDDPDSGGELVSFSDEELAAAFLEASSTDTDGFDIFELLVGWSEDGSEWVWQTGSDAFSVPEPAPGFLSSTAIDVAVGGDFVIARTETSEFPTTPPVEYEDGDAESPTVPGAYSQDEWNYSPPPSRWFIARVG